MSTPAHEADALSAAPTGVTLSKRQLLRMGVGLGLAPLAGLLGERAWSQAPAPEQALLDPATVSQHIDKLKVCYVATQSVEGPFYLDQEIVRADIRDGQPGQKIKYRFEITNANRLCAPVPSAVVAIWQCNALGVYSGYPDAQWNKLLVLANGDEKGHLPATGKERFLRGMQKADDRGMVEFTAIIPGWYAPRVAHVHVRVFLSEREAATTQCYFPQSLLNNVYTQRPYVQHGPGPYTNENDLVRKQSGADGNSVFTLSYDTDGSLIASARLGLSHV